MTEAEKKKKKALKENQDSSLAEYEGMSIVTEQGAFAEIGIDNSIQAPKATYEK